MALVFCGLLAPLLWLTVALGLGLLVERIGSQPLPGALLAPVGLAAAVVLSQLLMLTELAAPAAPWALVAAAGAGWFLGRGRLRFRDLDRWLIAAGVAVYLTVAAPVLLSGSATFAAYGLDTTGAIHVMGADWLIRHGLDFSGIPASNYRRAMLAYFDTGYPSGAHTAFGALGKLTGQDLAYLYTEFMAFCVALIACVAHALVRPLGISRRMAALIGFISAQPALVYAYALQGAIKELVALPAILAMAPLVALLVRSRSTGWRALVPLAVVVSAGLGALGLAFAVWLGPVALGCAVAVVATRRYAWRSLLRLAAAGAALVAVLSLSTVVQASAYVSSTGFLTKQSEFGNLLRPLRAAQALGIWIGGDYRVPPEQNAATWILIGVAAGGVVMGVAWLWRRRAYTMLFLAGYSTLACAYIVATGSPWAGAKALMILSPVALLLAAVGATALARAGWRLESMLLMGALAVGVLWSNALVYHDTALARRARLDELAQIARREPASARILSTEFEDYALWFMRGRRFFSPGDAWAIPVRERSGQVVGYGKSVDLDQLPIGYVTSFDTIVLRRSPAASRPPAGYRLASSGRFYDVWHRDRARARRILEHVPFGTGAQASAVPACARLAAIASSAPSRGRRLLAAERPRSVVVAPASLSLPRGWFAQGSGGAVVMKGPGRLEVPLRLRGGRFGVWLGGSFGRRVSVLLDGRHVGSVTDDFSEPGQYAYIGGVRLAPGSHHLTIRVGGGDLAPGNGGARVLDSVVVAPAAADRPRLRAVPRLAWRRLCGESLDWLEVVS